jgi:aryl-alcohol dehydrogenase-like predicted oxidoreductase
MDLTAYRTLGRSGLRISPLTLGNMTFGDPSWGADRDTSFAILDRYIEAGGNSLDTADKYNHGRAEEVLGAYIAARPGLRDRLVIATKFGGSMDPEDPNAGGAGRKTAMAALDASLHRLGTDYVDLYWPHNWDPHTPLEETMATLDDLVRAGKVRYVGLSDFPAWAIARAETTAELRGLRSRVAAIQLEYSLLERTVEGEQFGVAKELGLGVLPWSPLASGALTGKYTPNGPAPRDSGRGQFAAPHLNARTFELLERMGIIADELDASVASIALAWVRQQPTVTSTLIGARTVEQLDKNLASLDVELDPVHLSALDQLTAPRLGFPLEFLRGVGPGFLQGDTTINGVAATAFAVS